jgi:hypothetical protein
MKVIYLTACLVMALGAYAQLPKQFKAENQCTAPDYSNEKYWSALPFREDAAFVTPNGEQWKNDSLKEVDVFYIYPTLYRKGNTWCADVNDEKLNKKLDKLPVKYQASPFNKVARVYAPRYRQAHIDSFSDSTGVGRQALDFAYGDVKAAFEYYLKYYNNGRPIIIVSHSQGTCHARRLLKDYFDTPDMKKKLICAYVVGYGIFPEQYQLLKPCGNAAETNCYVTWSSFKEGYEPEEGSVLVGKVNVNPVSWKTDTVTACGKGGILLSINRKKYYCTKAKVQGGYLSVKTNMPFVRKWKVMHLVDFNLFWQEIRENVALRAAEYKKNNIAMYK